MRRKRLSSTVSSCRGRPLLSMPWERFRASERARTTGEAASAQEALRRSQGLPGGTGGGTGAGMLSQLGTITVDQNGAGRLQQKVESARVRDVVGQAIVLYSQAAPPQTAVPVNPGTNSPSRPGVGGPISAGNYDQRLKGGAKTPVAGGIIQLINDRRPPAAVPQSTQAPAGTNGAVEQPASATPPVRQNLVR